ncbi:hypothetical protein WM40_17810 [Robbsia andropogonis]|uniref:SAF domain-containing protein n=1 Tax=Robbsia andropogonis TaxID=28092 RepID=A0A0F5JWU4_9BURK|nr:Flp pilus assembly protein CpaB [Robbsia andropogonis]KKB62328.1 hypothetical protein WM40_17810 [Robbsia andropogonis]
MSNVIKLLLLLVGSVLVLFIAKTVISLSTRGPEQAPPEPKIRVSAADLPQGLLLRDDDLQWKNVPADRVPSDAIILGAAGAPDLKGALLRHAVVAGTVLHAADVILPNAPGFLAATLKPGMLAVSVAVDDVSGNAGLIEPGDYVDLLLTQQAPDYDNSGNAHSYVSETVLQHVRVLASGSELERPKNPDGSSDQRRSARTVTLEVTPHMSEVVSVAGRLGSLSLALRSFATTSRDNPGLLAASGLQGITPVGPTTDALPPPVWSRDVTRALQAPAPPPSGAPASVAPVQRPVVIYRGSSAGTDTAVGSMSGGAGTPPLPQGMMTPRAQ